MRVEELVVVGAAAPQVMRVLTTLSRMPDWVAPDVTIRPREGAERLVPGARFDVEILGGVRVEYRVEARSDRDLVLAFTGPWNGRERWTIISDGGESVVRRIYEVDEGAPLADLAWRTVGRAVVMAHYRLELSRFRQLVERLARSGEAGPIGEIASPGQRGAAAGADVPFPVDEG